MLKPLRMQVQLLLADVPARRKPALRRSDEPNALLATDLPLIADDAAVTGFVRAAETLGWRTRMHRGWLLLDAPVPAPECDVPVRLQGSCGCCLSLLLRHREEAPAEDLIRAVVKAADAGRQPLERLCGQLHGELAARLRRHEPLPGALIPYLSQAYPLLMKE